MKVNIVTKRIAAIIVSFLLLQYVSIIFPVLHVNAKAESIVDTLQTDMQENVISITKDESMLNLNKVNINIKVPENTYTIILPDGNSSIDNNLIYEVTENGQYVFEFVDIQGNSKYRVVHVNTIQNRKVTKVPVVTASNGKIKLESDCIIEYSLDSKNWEEYEKEIDYKEPIFARVVDAEFECSTIKITLKQNGELEVQNTESREIYGEILNNINSDFINEVNDEKNESDENNTGNQNISNVNIEYSLVYKEYVNIDCKQSTKEDENKKVENGGIYNYKKIKMNSGDEEKDFWKETYIKYAYIDSGGNLISNIEVINKAKEEMEKLTEKIKYTKIVGNKGEFYILTEQADVYFISTKNDVINSELQENSELIKRDEKLNYLIAKLNIENIVNIYDSYTALTKDGEIVSLMQNSEEDIIKELQSKTDKYLVASHIGLKNGKLYNFENSDDGKEVTYGKLVTSDEPELGIYSESKETIKIFEHDSNNDLIIPELEEDEVYIKIESDDKELPEFIDIAEYGETSLIELSYLIEDKQVECEDIEQYTKCYAITKNGQIWAVIDEYIVDTGENINYFTPTSNYTLNNTSWTNESVILNTTENTKSQIISKDVKKGEEIIDEEAPYEIATNGEYIVTVKDSKERVYDITINVENIDKINPDVAYTGKIEKGIANIVAYDKEDTANEFAKSGINKIELTYETPKVDTEWITLEGKINEEGKMIAQVKQIHETKFAYVRTIDNAGNVSTIRKIDFKEELDEEEQKNQIEEQERLQINQNSTQIEEQEFKNSNLFENIDENNGEILYLILGIILIIGIGLSMYIKI